MGNTSCCCSSSPSNEDYQDLINKLDTVKEMSEVDQLISYIDQLLKAIDQQRHVASTAQVGSSVNSVGGLLEKILKRSDTHICKRDVIPNLNRETRKFAIDVTNQASKIQWVGITLSVVGFVLERVDQISSNKVECMKLIRYMFDLAKHMKQLDEHLARDKLNRIIQFIVEGCLMCLSQMKSHSLSKFFAAPVAAEDLRRFQAELGINYQDLTLEAIPTQTVGFEGAVNQVTQLLNMKGGSVRVVVIYGQGGIGKTTLATSVFCKLDLKDYKYCRAVMEQNCSEADLKSLQQHILRDLFGPTIDLRDLTEGREKLLEEFKKPQSQPVFIFIDNALKQSDIEKLLPITDLSFLPTHSRILITTRNLSEAEIILQANIEFHSYPIASLQQEQAQKLLCQFALENGQANFDPTIDVQGLLQICQGIPLVLKIAGAKLRPHAHNVQSCREMVKHLEKQLLDGEQGEISERMVDFVYHRLDASCKEAFLDIVFFFHNWEQSKVVFSVGEIEFQELEKAALVNITDENRVNVHDIVKARGRMLSPENGERITDLESLTDVERIKKTKGICLSGDFELEASHLNLMKKSLRVLILTEGAKIINGECNGAFENLRLLSLDNDNNYSQLDVSKHQRLEVLILRYDVFSNFPKVASMASSLKYVIIANATLVNFTTILSQFQTLRSLALSNCRGFESLPESFGNLSSLQKLDLRQCSSLVSLSNNFGSLVGLVEIDLSFCSNLTNLPESFGNLSSLQKLDLRYCSSLVSLSNNFGSLVGLVEIDLSSCSNLTNLPESFGNLSSLQKLDLISCSSLVSLSNNFGSLVGLVEIHLSECSNLTNLPESFGNLSSLQKLDLSSCYSLVSLSNNFDSLVGLVEIHLSFCYNLTSLPKSFGNLSSLQKLDLRYCFSLVSLSNNFGSLVGLVDLYLGGCAKLSVLPESLGNLRSLERLELWNCEKLSNLPQNFGHLKCLKYLSIAGCSELQSLSGDFECLSSLVAVRASKCSQLEENTMDKLAKIKGLMIVYIYESPMLKMRWEQVKDQYSLLVLTRAYEYSHEDVMRRAFFHRESRFLHVDENEQFGESPCPAVGVKLCLLLTACDLTSPSKSGYLEAVKRKWREAGSPSEEEEVGSVPDRAVQMILVEVGSSWEERERRARETLPLLPRGTTAWIAPDTRARVLFADSLFWARARLLFADSADREDIIVSISTSVDEEGRTQMHFLTFDNTISDVVIENRDSWHKILSPLSEASDFIRLIW